MIGQNLRYRISSIINAPIQLIGPISGGDISSAYKIQTSGKSYFLKLNATPDALKMFQQEAIALQAIAKTNTIKTPTVIDVASFENEHFILMEFIERKSPSNEDMALFGEQLAHLHQISDENFGFETNNFIGSLPQSNKIHNNWTDFYTEERLAPQLELAVKQQLLSPSEVPNIQIIKSKTAPYFNSIKPSLLHGDMWSGNYVISKNGSPYLIDPSTYFGHAEVDIAMSLLFGGFGNSFYQSYRKFSPETKFSKQRIELYQLYYLIVHLNLFGKSYYNSVKGILNKYF